MSLSKWIIEAYLAQELTNRDQQFSQQRITQMLQPPDFTKTLIAFLVDDFSQEEIAAYNSGDWKDDIGIEIKKEVIRRKTR